MAASCVVVVRRLRGGQPEGLTVLRTAVPLRSLTAGPARGRIKDAESTSPTQGRLPARQARAQAGPVEGSSGQYLPN